MANIIQIYEIVNSLAQQALNMKGLTATDASFVSVGEEVFKSDTNTDAFYNVLLDRVGRTAVSMRKYYATGRNIKREPIEWGMAMQKLTVPLSNATQNTTWNNQDTEHSDPFAKSPVAVNQKIFSKLSVWELDSTIPDVQLKTAFTSPQAMGAFIESLMLAAENSLTLQVQSTTNFCRASFMARKLKQGGLHAIDLLKNFNTDNSASLTTAQALNSVDFLRYSAMQISLISRYFADMSVAFSDGTLQRHTPEDVRCLDVLSEFSKRMGFYLQSDTYHKELVSMPKFEEVSFWQAAGNYSFDNISAINLSYVDNSGETPTTVTTNEKNIVAVLYDYEAMGTTIQNRRTRSIYNPKDEYTNYFHKAEIGYFNDVSENGVVFTINGTPATPPTPETKSAK